MNESFVDLTYRGLSLGRRIKLTQVRPSSGTLELPGPMPVGTAITIATDDDVQFEATVAWVHEQVAGSDRPPGMIVVPHLAADHAVAWWTAHVVLPDEELLRPRPRSRPVTARPRTPSRPTPASQGPLTDQLQSPAVIADLDARVAAAAGVAPPPVAPPPVVVPPEPPAAPPAASAAGAPELPASAASLDDSAASLDDSAASLDDSAARLDDDDDEPEVTVTSDEEVEPVLRTTGEHAVVDDGKPTTIMQSVDLASLGFDAGMSGEFTDPGTFTGEDGDAAGEGEGAQDRDADARRDDGRPDTDRGDGQR